jgi:serine/threonine protein kinase
MTRELSEEFVWHVCEAVSSALAKCHYGLEAAKSETTGAEYYGFTIPWTQVLHRDIKPGNGMYHSKHQNQQVDTKAFARQYFSLQLTATLWIRLELSSKSVPVGMKTLSSNWGTSVQPVNYRKTFRNPLVSVPRLS